MTNLEARMTKLEEGVIKLDKRVSNLEAGMTKLETGVRELDDRTRKLEADMTYVKIVQLENSVIPRLNTIEKYYVDTSERYLEKTDQIDRMDSDISILKQVVANHSETLKKAQ